MPTPRRWRAWSRRRSGRRSAASSQERLLPRRPRTCRTTTPSAAVEAAPETAEHAVAEPEPEPPPEAEPEPEPEPRDQAGETWLEDEPEPPAEPEEPEEVVVGQPAVEHGSPADPPAEGEDVLEETPDFLQETPEHDRLWFEQKPPRDFDLDR